MPEILLLPAAFLPFHPGRSGRRWATSTTRCGTACWAGTSPTTAWAILTGWAFSLITLRKRQPGHGGQVPQGLRGKAAVPERGPVCPEPLPLVSRTEDIINRGGGNVLIRVYNSLPDESIDYESEVTVHTDGRTYTVPAGTRIRLTPGESIHVQAVPVPRLHGGRGQRPGAAGGGQPVQRRQHRQPV